MTNVWIFLSLKFQVWTRLKSRTTYKEYEAEGLVATCVKILTIMEKNPSFPHPKKNPHLLTCIEGYTAIFKGYLINRTRFYDYDKNKNEVCLSLFWDFGDWAGTYGLIYSNGHRNTFTIGCDGLVTSVHHDGFGQGQLTTSYDSNCPGFPCMRLEGIYASGKYEFLSLTGNTLSVKHYNPGLCCTATANRVARDCGNKHLLSMILISKK